jgi:hypothetical protein
MKIKKTAKRGKSHQKNIFLNKVGETDPWKREETFSLKKM